MPVGSAGGRPLDQFRSVRGIREMGPDLAMNWPRRCSFDAAAIQVMVRQWVIREFVVTLD
jgi:hypothetical protein